MFSLLVLDSQRHLQQYSQFPKTFPLVELSPSAVGIMVWDNIMRSKSRCLVRTRRNGAQKLRLFMLHQINIRHILCMRPHWPPKPKNWSVESPFSFSTPLTSLLPLWSIPGKIKRGWLRRPEAVWSQNRGSGNHADRAS